MPQITPLHSLVFLPLSYSYTRQHSHPDNTSLNCSLLGFVCGGLHSGCLCSTTWLAAVVVHASPRSVDLSSAYGVGSDVVKAGVISR